MAVPTRLSPATIRFTGTLARAAGAASLPVLALPKDAWVQLPARGSLCVELAANGFPLRTTIVMKGKGGRRLEFDPAICEAAAAHDGDSVSIEITRVGDEPETRVPADLGAALIANPAAGAQWDGITPMARRDWILWLSTARQEETRRKRIEKACDMLSRGKRRVCCFPGLTWLRQDHPDAGEPWLALTKTGKPGRSSP